jgi:hypothetical protein
MSIRPTRLTSRRTLTPTNSSAGADQLLFVAVEFSGGHGAVGHPSHAQRQSPTPFPNLDILGDANSPRRRRASSRQFRGVVKPIGGQEWYFGVTTHPGQIQPVAYDLTFYLVETNDLGVSITNTSGYFSVISNLNSVLKPYYVYQYGTSMAAGAVSGMLALMQEFLQSNTELG